jgi:hypothetical protein
MNSISRRQFLARTTATAAGLWLTAPQFLRAQGLISANDKLNIGVIGVAGQGGYSISQLKDITNIVALCDVDEKRLAPVAQKFPSAKTYRDFRRLTNTSKASPLEFLLSMAVLYRPRSSWVPK